MRTLLAIMHRCSSSRSRAAAAQAHAFLDHASPLVGSTVPAAPHEVTLSFTQNLEPAFSTVEVTDASGARVDQGKAQISGNTMRVGLKSLGPGTYQRALARALGRHPHDGRQFHLPCRRSHSLTDPLIYARAIHFAATILVAGVVFFAVFIAEPALRGASDATARRCRRSARGLPWIAWISLALAAISGAAWLVLTAAAMSGQPAVRRVFATACCGPCCRKPTFGNDWLVAFRRWLALLAAALPSLAVGANGSNRLGSRSQRWFWPRRSPAPWPGPATPSAASASRRSSIRPPTCCISSPRRRGSARCVPLALLADSGRRRRCLARDGANGDAAIFDPRHRQRRHAARDRHRQYLVSRRQHCRR